MSHRVLVLISEQILVQQDIPLMSILARRLMLCVFLYGVSSHVLNSCIVLRNGITNVCAWTASACDTVVGFVREVDFIVERMDWRYLKLRALICQLLAKHLATGLSGLLWSVINSPTILTSRIGLTRYAHVNLTRLFGEHLNLWATLPPWHHSLLWEFLRHARKLW